MARSNLRRAGLIEVDLDGELLDVVGDLQYNLGGEGREPLAGADRYHGYSVTAEPATFEFTVRDGSGLDVAKLKATTGARLQAELASGKSVVLHDAAQIGTCRVSTESGEIETSWIGEFAEEIGADE